MTNINNVTRRILLPDAVFAGYVVGSTATFSVGFALYVYSMLGHDAGGGYDAASFTMRIKQIGAAVMTFILVVNAVVAALLIVMHAAGIPDASRLLQHLRGCCASVDEERRGRNERDDDFLVLSFDSSEASGDYCTSRLTDWQQSSTKQWQMRRSLSLNDMEQVGHKMAKFLSCFSSGEYEIQLLVADVMV